jgi:hypothetical protein
MPSSSTQAACSSSFSFPDYADAFAQHETGLVQTLRRVIEAAALSAGYVAQYIGYSYFHFYSKNTLIPGDDFISCECLENSIRHHF